MDTWQYIVIVVVLLIIALAIVKMNKKDVKLEFNKLVELLGQNWQKKVETQEILSLSYAN